MLGFPDDYTLVPWGDGMFPDTHRNATLGNTIAVPVVRWIGRRIDAVQRILDATEGR